MFVLLQFKLKQNNMKNKLYILEHNGHSLGGVIVVIEENIEKAKIRICATLISRRIREFNIDNVKEVDLDTPKVVFLNT